MKRKEAKKLSDKPVMESKERIVSDQIPGTGQISNFTLFMKVGIIVLSIIAIIGFGIQILPGSVTVSTINNKREQPIYSVDIKENKVALSFDVSWGNEDIPNVLEVLAENNVKATFFVTGDWVERYPDDVKQITLAGHDIGNHSKHHEQMSELSKEECIEEIMEVHNKVKELTEIDMNLFRAPYGDYNDILLEAATDCGYDTIQWNIDSMDWKDYGVASILSKTVENKKLGNGSILLLHVGTKYTVEALEKIITGLQEKGYEIVPVSELIYTGEYKVDQMGRQFTR